MEEIVLKPEQEFRFEVDFKKNFYITLRKGTGEIFGTEMALNRKYKFSGTKRHVFTWDGCVLETEGEGKGYVGEDTPMKKNPNIGGPRVLVTGPPDSGKSSVSKILLNYSLREESSPCYVDLDIGNGESSIPGAISAQTLVRPIDIEEGISISSSIVYFFGYLTIKKNRNFFRELSTQLSKTINEKINKVSLLKSSGIIVNTMSFGCEDNNEYLLLLDLIRIFEIDIVIVLGDETLYNDLKIDLDINNKKIKNNQEKDKNSDNDNNNNNDNDNDNDSLNDLNQTNLENIESLKKDDSQVKTQKKVDVIHLLKSGGVKFQSKQFRKKYRFQKIRDYFYGTDQKLNPYSFEISFLELKFYTISDFIVPKSALPIGRRSTLDPVRVNRTDPNESFQSSIVAVSFANIDGGELTSSDIKYSNIAGFIFISQVDTQKQKLSYLSPSSVTLPGKIVIVGDIKWIDYHY
ncbi:polyribonucleotide 5'-hydroxyl-kinase clp1 [Anaeramoeba ignava]|uniref:Polyribonucleotide 5'-hydroxyl-kinase clp1 n=1 Tax=Anaeramoeba ignava TaxID=1746090 RepID=A0A9Q0L6V8_ANAIG|nr:polyribonucleotide 5'-hydroxyl-kinase clp1 [Anaeramoeba ignava]